MSEGSLLDQSGCPLCKKRIHWWQRKRRDATYTYHKKCLDATTDFIRRYKTRVVCCYDCEYHKVKPHHSGGEWLWCMNPHGARPKDKWLKRHKITAISILNPSRIGCKGFERAEIKVKEGGE